MPHLPPSPDELGFLEISGDSGAGDDGSLEHLVSRDPSLGACIGTLKGLVRTQCAIQQQQANVARTLTAVVLAQHNDLGDGSCSGDAVFAPQQACTRGVRQSEIDNTASQPSQDSIEDEVADAPRDSQDLSGSDVADAPQGFHRREVVGEAVRRSGGEDQIDEAPQVQLQGDVVDEAPQVRRERTESSRVASRKGISTIIANSTSLAGRRLQTILADKTKAQPRASITTLGGQNCLPSLQRLAGRILQWGGFEYAMGVVILLHSALIGVETEQGLKGGRPWAVLSALEVVFTIIYAFELSVRALAWGRSALGDTWFLFDFVLLLSGGASLLIAQPGLVAQLAVLRICRLLRLLRVLRTIPQLRSVWRLVYGLLSSFNTMASTLFLITLVLYTFACLGVELITKDVELRDPQHPELKAIVDENFGDVLRTMLFLFQFVTLDSVAAVYAPLIKRKPLLCIYFLSVALVVSVSLMNLVMAKIVETALETARNDSEAERELQKHKLKSMIPLLEDLFHSLDKEGDGRVYLEDVKGADASTVPEELLAVIKFENVEELFDTLDIDGNGELSQEEFIEGTLELQMTDGSDVPTRQLQALRMTRTLQQKIDALESILKPMSLMMGISPPSSTEEDAAKEKRPTLVRRSR